MKKTILITTILFFMTIFLTACGEEKAPVLNAEAEAGDYNGMTFSEDQLPEGLYIAKEDNLFYQLLNIGFSNAQQNVYQWFTSDYDTAIPTLTTDDKLIYYSNVKRPTTLTIYKMTNYGYTIGTLFNVALQTEDINIPVQISFAGVYNELSPVESYIAPKIPENAEIAITKINGKDFKTSMLTIDGFLKGLTQDAIYKIGFYSGTVFNELNIKADSHLFVQEEIYTSSSYRELGDMYFEILLPSNLTEGFYYIEDYGLFYYKEVIKLLEEDPDVIEPITTTETQEETESK